MQVILREGEIWILLFFCEFTCGQITKASLLEDTMSEKSKLSRLP